MPHIYIYMYIMEPTEQPARKAVKKQVRKKKVTQRSGRRPRNTKKIPHIPKLWIKVGVEKRSDSMINIIVKLTNWC